MIDPDNLIGRTYTWHTGLTATVRGYAEDVSRSGNMLQRLTLIFQTESSSGVQALGPRSLIVYPYPKFVAALRPWDELTITGSGPDVRVYGPRPDTAAQIFAGLAAIGGAQ